MKILIVDDEKSEREGIRFLIEKFGFPLVIAEACNGKTALEYLEKHRDVDILLTDVKMPYMDGLELAECVNEKNPDLFIVIFSAYSEFEYAKKACAANAVNYLLKPVEVDEFEAVMRQVIGRCQERQKAEGRKEDLRQAEKKLWLYRLLNSEDSVAEIVEKLKCEYQINLENKYMCFVTIETRNNYFELHEEEFEQILSDHLLQSYETINLYPNLSYVLLYSSSNIDERKLEASIRKIYAMLSDRDSEMVSMIVGEKFYGMKHFKERLGELETTMRDTFSYFSGIIYAAKKNPRDVGSVEESIQMKESIYRSIEDKNMEAVKEQLLVYLKRLEHEKSSSAFYAKYLILDIIKEIYQQYGIYNETMILQIADDVMNSNDLRTVGEVISRVTDEIILGNEKELPDGSMAVAAIKKVIKNEYMNDIGLEDIAERVCLSPSYVSFIFKKETGNNLVKYLTDYRMKKAKEMLEESNRKIVDIGRACGYQNQPYFNKLFKNYYGVTPRQYREK